MLKRLALIALLFPCLLLQGAERVFDFSDDALNSVPAGFRSTVAGSGPAGEWKVIEADAPAALPSLSGASTRRTTRRAVAQVSRDTTDERFPLLIFDGDSYNDFAFTVNIKMVEGEKEQMAGIAFRIQDEKNYYYVRASALGGSLYFFKVVDGLRSEPIGARFEIAKGIWHELKVECQGNKIHVAFDGREAIPWLLDKSFTAGKLGFWTKSDSVSHFANARLTYTPREILAQSLVRDALARHKSLENMMIFSRGAKDPEIKVVASARAEDIGRPATALEKDVLEKSKIYHSKISKTVTMTLPLHDANGDTIAAVRLVMKSFPGETEKTSITRAVPIVRTLEARIRNHEELVN